MSWLTFSAAQRGETDLVFVTRDGRRLRRNSLRYNFVRMCAGGERAFIKNTATARTPEMHDLRHTFAVHVLEAWVREGKDSRQKLPVLSGYMGHALLKSTELYLRLVPEDSWSHCLDCTNARGCSVKQSHGHRSLRLYSQGYGISLLCRDGIAEPSLS